MDCYPVGRSIQSVLPKLLKSIDLSKGKWREEILKAWPQVVGEQVNSYTEVVDCDHDTLTIRVKSATLYSMLVMQERERILKKFQEKYPELGIKKIVFRR